MSRKQLVFNYMMINRTALTMEINAVTVGGSEGCKRLRELKAEGRLNYSSVREPGSTQFRYTLID